MPIKMQDVIHDGVNPDRARPDMIVSDSPPNGFGGITMFKGKRVESIMAPFGGSALERTIRIHELLHANRSPQPPKRSKFPVLAIQATEDARVHFTHWPVSKLPMKANRDCLAIGLREIHRLPPLAALADADDWNKALLLALRGAAIVARLGSQTDKRRADQRIRAAFGDRVASALGGILNSLSRRTYCNRAFTNLMREPNDIEPHMGNQKGTGSNGAASDSPMRIVKLPLVESCYSAVRRTALARSGARLNRARLANAIATGSTAGLFIRQRYLPGGTYLFDASGSMNLSDERLQALCNSAPAATVAFYSGPGRPDETGCYGELVIYAQGGRRAATVDRVHGGNEVDLYAIQWLLAQRGPRVYIGDGGFCGGPEGQDIRAEVLLRAAVAAGKVEWQQTT